MKISTTMAATNFGMSQRHRRTQQAFEGGRRITCCLLRNQVSLRNARNSECQCQDQSRKRQPLIRMQMTARCDFLLEPVLMSLPRHMLGGNHQVLELVGARCACKRIDHADCLPQKGKHEHGRLQAVGHGVEF